MPPSASPRSTLVTDPQAMDSESLLTDHLRPGAVGGGRRKRTYNEKAKRAAVGGPFERGVRRHVNGRGRLVRLCKRQWGYTCGEMLDLLHRKTELTQGLSNLLAGCVS